MSGDRLRTVAGTSLVASASVATVGLLSPFPAWVVVVAAVTVGLIAPAVVVTHLPVESEDPDG